MRVFSFSRLYPKLLFPGKSLKEQTRLLGTPNNTLFSIDTLNPISWKRTARQIAAFSPTLLVIPVWITYLVPPLLSIIATLRPSRTAKLLFICHNVIPHDAGQLHLRMMRRLLDKGDFAIVHSQKEKHLINSIAPGLRVLKHYHPIYDFFARGRPGGNHQALSELARDNLRLSKHKLVLLFFGFVRPYKGLDLLIRAIPEISRRLDVALLIVGEFWRGKRRFERMLGDLGVQSRVTIIDRYVPDEQVWEYFEAADLVVLPYREATQSGVIQIAFGFGKPVLTTDVGGLSEVVEDGKTGYVVPANDPGAIADAVIRFSRQRSEVDFGSNIASAREEFSWERLAGLIEEVAIGREDGVVSVD